MQQRDAYEPFVLIASALGSVDHRKSRRKHSTLRLKSEYLAMLSYNHPIANRVSCNICAELQCVDVRGLELHE